MTLITRDYSGKVLKPGDTVTDFRGDTAIFKAATRAPSEGRTGKVLVTDQVGEGSHGREYYMEVFDLIVIEAECSCYIGGASGYRSECEVHRG